MKLVYVGSLDRHSTSLHRMQALRRIGFEVHGFDTVPYDESGGPLASRLRIRLLAGRAVDRLNADLVAVAAALRPDFIWFDKPMFVRGPTLRRLRRGGAVLVNYICDNPFHTIKGEPGWRGVRKVLAQYDVNLVPRPSSVDDYRAAGAPLTLLLPFAFDPLYQFPPPPDTAPATVPVTFIGSPYDERPRFLADLAGRGVPVAVRGNGWQRHARLAGRGLTFAPAVPGHAYRLALWDADIALSFVTHAHRDTTAHRSFEITACGTALLAERTDDHSRAFDEGREAEFFGSVAEAADKAAFYGRSPAARRALALAGCRRAWRAGYSNDARIAAIFRELDPALGARLASNAEHFLRIRRHQLGLE